MQTPPPGTNPPAGQPGFGQPGFGQPPYNPGAYGQPGYNPGAHNPASPAPGPFVPGGAGTPLGMALPATAPLPPVAISSPRGFLPAPNRFLVGVGFLFLGIASIALLTLLLRGRAAQLILDYPSQHFLYPFTIQNAMHLLFFFCLGELVVRLWNGFAESRYSGLGLLPEDDATVLQSHDLGHIRRKVAPLLRKHGAHLPNLINLAILQFQSSRSVDQTASIVNSALELIAHRVDLAFNLARFLAWMVPTLGFIGTVYSLGASLSEAGDPTKTLDLQAVSRTLGVGFDTTMVALVESAILVFLIHVTQEMEESAVNSAGEYTLRNLVNRLYSGPVGGRS